MKNRPITKKEIYTIRWVYTIMNPVCHARQRQSRLSIKKFIRKNSTNIDVVAAECLMTGMCPERPRGE